MDHISRKDPNIESSQSYLGNSRVILNHFDAATQADIQHTALSYESEDEGRTSRRSNCSSTRSYTPVYSKHDIREQYCISERGLGALETARGTAGSAGLFGCLSSQGGISSPCTAAAKGGSLLTVCVRRRVPSDENIHELYRRQPADYAPMPRQPRYPFGAPPDPTRYEDDLEWNSYFRRRPRSLCGAPIPPPVVGADPSRYTWLPADEDCYGMERPRPIRPPEAFQPPYRSAEALVGGFGQPPHVAVVCGGQLPPHLQSALHDTSTIQRTKHVSFARSHTLTSFDDAVVGLGRSRTTIGRSQERLLDGRKTADPTPVTAALHNYQHPPITRQPEPLGDPQKIILEKMKRTPMKTQATQTEVCLGRKPNPPNQLTLSPRTIHRVKMVSQGAQTNGITLQNGRKLTKSYSEAGAKFGQLPNEFDSLDHEPLQRTQSEEPPKSPYIVKTPPESPDHAPISEGSTENIPEHSEVSRKFENNTDDDEEENSENDHEDLMYENLPLSKVQKEIIIDFEPQSSPVKKKPLLKTSSDGEILLDKRKNRRASMDSELIPEKVLTSISHDNICVTESEPRSFTPYFQDSPIRHENIFKTLSDDFSGTPIHAGFRPQDSLDEEFHENLIYGGFHGRGIFRKPSTSLSEQDGGDDEQNGDDEDEENDEAEEEEEDCVVPSFQLRPDQRISPFASTDSLTNDIRDHSDGIWNESQVTVLQADSGTDNGGGTGLSASDTGTPSSGVPGGSLLTPSSRRKHLLMLQHQQRSSMDTDALDEEIQNDQIQQPIRSTSPHVPTISLKPPEIKLPKRKPASPATRKRRTPEPNYIPPSPERQVVPDLLLARTDSGKTNTTDLSESTTTTDDYFTANSGTDSSRRSRSGSYKSGERIQQNPVPDPGNSFDSASSLYSVARSNEDMVVPSFSPPPIPEETTSDVVPEVVELPQVVVPAASIAGSGTTGRTSPSGTSSSSGSYSLNGSCPDLLSTEQPLQQRPPVPSPRHAASISDDDRSVHYSSSGYYESPLEDDSTSKAPKSSHEWTEEEKRKKKRGFVLEISKHQSTEDQKYHSPNNDSHSQNSQKSPKIIEENDLTPVASPRTEKQKRIRSRTRSPMQMARKGQKKSPPGIGKSPGHEGFKSEEWEKRGVDEKHSALMRSSDDSSSGVCGDVQGQMQGQVSPRKMRKIREQSRRKSTPRSPISSRSKRRSGSGEDNKPSSLPGSLPRRKSKPDHEEVNTSKNRLSPYNRSPTASPKRKPQKPQSPEVRLKALSAESLRSVSPGSDSVFYSDPSSHGAISHLPAETQVHCLHCGKEVDIINTEDPDKSNASSNGVPGVQPDIVQPPAGFADSPRQKHAGRLYKKLEKRFRSEERGERRCYKYRADQVRAKSEERGKKECSDGSIKASQRLRPTSRSTDASLEHMRGGGSSPSILSGSPEAEDDCGTYTEPFTYSNWIFISDIDEMKVWQKTPTPDSVSQGSAGVPEDILEQRRDSTTSTGSTDSEHEFKKKYQAITHRMVHRKSCLEMYKRQASKSFVVNELCNEESTLRKNLEELFKLMLVIWCRENEANKIISSKINESDKTVVLRRESGEFGFRIHGSKPVVVSAIEPDTPAESSGLEVGDIVLAVNGVSVLDKSHSEVVKIAHAGSDTLTLEVARTCGVLSPTSPRSDDGWPGDTALYCGYLWKQGGQVSGHPTNKWIRRWFVLKNDNCLYSYKTDSDTQPVGAMMLLNYDITLCPDSEPGAQARPYRIALRKPGVPTLHIAADNETAATRWQTALRQASERARHSQDGWLEQTRRNLQLSPAHLQKPDCFGYLNKLGSRWKTWTRRYCVLKDACLYFYQDANSKNSFGMACLHGYRVQQSQACGKKHAFEILPSDTTQKHFYFHTETEMDRKRWIAALEYSIDRWLKVV